MTKIRRSLLQSSNHFNFTPTSEKRPAYISKSYCLSSEYVLRSILGYYSSISIYNRNCSYIDKLASCQVSRAVGGRSIAGVVPLRLGSPASTGHATATPCLKAVAGGVMCVPVPEAAIARAGRRARQGALPKATPAPVPSASAKAKANFPARQPLAAAAVCCCWPATTIRIVCSRRGNVFFPAWNDLSVASGLRHNFRSKR